MNDIKIIIDQYGNPNQPFWTSWLDMMIKSGFSFELYASQILRENYLDIRLITNNNRLEKIKSYVFLKLRNSKRIQLSKALKYNYALSRKAGLVHFLNAQMYPALSDMIPSDSKLLFTFRGYDTLVRPKKDKTWKNQLIDIYNKATVLHFVSNYLKDTAVKIGADEKKCFVIRRSVDHNFFSPIPREENKTLQILSVGRLIWQKGLKDGLESLSTLKRSGYKFEYTICGSGEDEEKLKGLCEILELDENVKFVGQKKPSEVKSYLNFADIFLHPSVSEGLPNAVLEAMSMGVPVVSTIVGGIPEIVDDRSSGLLVEPGNCDDLSSALSKLMDSNNLRRKLGVSGREKILLHFNKEREMLEWSSLYSRCLN